MTDSAGAGDPDAPAGGEPSPWRRRWTSFTTRRTARHASHKAEKAAKPRRKAPWWELPLLVVVAIVIAILVKTFVVQPFYIPS